MKRGTIIKGQIESISFGGDGIMRHDGKVIFVPFVVPNETISAKITHDKKSFAKANLLNVIQRNAERVSPLCEYFGQCGGCQLQHLAYEAQLKVKHQFVVDALTRIGGLLVSVLPVVKTSNVWAYRRHIKLHIVSRDGIKLTYVRFDGNGSVSITHCPIFATQNSSIIVEVQSLLERMKIARSDKAGEVSIMKAEEGYVILFSLAKVPRNLESLFLSAVAQSSLIKGILWREKEKETVRAVGEASLRFELDHLCMVYSPLSFVQAHPEQSAALYRALCERVMRAPASRVIDLYCGIGATSLLLARAGARVIGIEQNPQAIALAEQNARTNAITSAEFLVGDADEHYARIHEQCGPDVVVVNPPRVGLGEGVRAALTALKPARIMYISCMPATLARDLKAFDDAGYEVVYCQPFDMFPQTTHVETLVELRLRT